MTVANRGKNAANKRYGLVNKAMLRDQAARLRKAANKLDALVLVIDAFGLGQADIRIDGVTKWTHGIGLIDTFLEKVENGIASERYSRRITSQ